MEVMVGPAFSIGVSPSTPDAYVRDRSGTLPPAQPGLFEDDEKRDMTRNGFEPGYDISGQLKRQLDDEVSSDDSSSIGDPDADDSEEDAVLSSKLSSSLASLEDALPIKRGLSNHFSGKSKSFATLSEVDSTNSEVKVLEKPENPFNKRRRVLIGSKWSRKSSSFYNWANNPKSMPLLPLNEHGDEVAEERNDPSSSEDKDEEEDDDNYDERRRRAVKFHEKTRFITSNNFRSRSCFSLADLRQN